MHKLLTLFFVVLFSISSAVADDIRFVQISDVRFDAHQNQNLLHKAVLEINKQKGIDFVVFTGDNINKPTEENLEGFLSEVKKLNPPFYIVLGDKDINKSKEMSKKEYLRIVNKRVRKHKYLEPNYLFEKRGVVFIVADGSKEVIPSTNGFYKDSVLNFVANSLNSCKKNNVIIFQHFPLVPPINKETYYTFKPEEYLKILYTHHNVKAIVAGHFGVNSEVHKNGITHITTAGLPYYRVIDVLDCETENPIIWTVLKKFE